jgi:hypothetical protein
MNIRWDYLINQYDTARYIPNADGRDNRHIQFVREFASVVSILQVWSCATLCNLIHLLMVFLGQDEQRN